ncbi:class I adenylate-forming enzyme family protein [Rhizobium sp. SL86]|uniref:class I adenylate-forming enzyme family protein n=1 Tax=Rhizobium sp. SL86 TaxID=2995148 RepID=UPI00227238D9|nr:class I adenylate-forming enzyme family protein [Rhizobium sp. SL86]MCY1664833.1 class I adenylate-forming enzyme family protein [Rhizobium sp. SL86]
MRIELYLHRNAEIRPEAVAVVSGSRRMTYRALADEVARLASGLSALGTGRGDRVVFVLENTAEAVIAFFAVWQLGAMACPLHPSIKADKLAEILTRTAPTALITQARTNRMVSLACERAGLSPTVILTDVETAPDGAIAFHSLPSCALPQLPARSLDEDDLALLIHTSGSTGHPKGVMLTHRNLDFACSTICDYLGNDTRDVVLSVLPLSFGYGITQMVTMMMAGGTLVLERSFAFPRAILERLAEEQVTGFPLVPAMAGLITAMQDLQPGLLPHLRYMTSAAAAMPPAVTQALQRLFPDTALFLMYGQTECIRTCYLAPERAADTPLSVGRPLPGTQVQIIGEDGTPVASGETGELQVCGPHVMAGYWRDEAATQRALVLRGGQRWLKSGDLFRQDGDGLLYYVARQDDIIKTRGEKVSPQEVERALYALPGVLEAAVEGVADPLFGQVVKAHVVPAPGVTLTERMVRQHCAEHLEDFMVPKLVEFRDALPKTSTGKIRLSLANTVSEDTEGKVA